ncbi:coronin-1B-like [Orbicella faveolata]|uniref:coronin-1B-like n=2 Tax=Orbicella faveolata TaxID=48498 RepID=UPI0009E4F7B7|nr:coronin-1B-like [Orbicella faveolata]
MSRGSFKVPRSSKFKHVFGNPYKKDRCYEAIRLSTKLTEGGSLCAVNPKFLAVVVESSGGGTFLVLPLEQVGRVPIDAPKVTGHGRPVLDIEWNPFNDQQIASSSEDSSIKIWHVPDDGLSMDLDEYLVDLRGHSRKVNIIRWHPCAEGVIASAAYDSEVRIWDIVDDREAATILKGHPDIIFSLSFNYNGSLLASTCKDKKIRVIDPRAGRLVAHGMGHQGNKSSHVVFLGDMNMLFSTGFSRMNERQIAIWDVRNLKKAIKIDAVDSSSGVLLPYYDHDTRIVYLAGKGDGNVRYYELSDAEPYFTFLNEYRSSSPQRGFGVMPKRGLDVTACEIYRFYKLHNNNFVEPIAMTVPRRQTGIIQRDLYPLTPSDKPSMKAREWIDQGLNRNPDLMDLLKDFPLQDGETETRDMRSREQREVASARQMATRSPTSESPPKSPVRVSSRNEERRSSDTNHVPSRGQNGESDIQYVKATEVLSRPDTKHKDPIQVTAKAVVNSRVSSPEKRRTGGDRRSGDFANWDIDTLRLAYSDQREEIIFLQTQLRARDAKIAQLEKENDYFREKSQRF